MLALRIIATVLVLISVLVSISVVKGIVKDGLIMGSIGVSKEERAYITTDPAFYLAMLWNLLWRTFVIICLWII